MDNNTNQKEMGMRFSPHKVKSHLHCCVFGCKSTVLNDPIVRFHSLPNDDSTDTVTILNIFGEKEEVSVRYAWEKALKMKKYSSEAKVCSLHFKKSDYVLPDISCKRRRLYKTAVPSLNLPATTNVAQNLRKEISRISNEKRTERVRRRSLQKKIQSKNDNFVESTENIEPIENFENSNPENNGVSVEQPVLLQLDEEVQVKMEVYLFLITNDKELNTMAGLPTLQYLYFLENVVKVVKPELASAYCKSQLSTKDRIVLTSIKLKQNISYAALAVMFKVCSEVNCRKIFFKIVAILSAGLKSFIYWPEKNEVLKNMLQCFNDFMYVRAVIDVIEMQIQCPNKMCCRLASYSAYKSAYTIRFMTAVTPAGLISFISDAYMGRSSDKSIFEQSNLIKLFEKDDGLMTDKGFLIDDLCLKHNVKLVRPPFLRNKKQFSREEALLNAKIAKARVHIERSNQRIKVFKILSTKIAAYLVPRIQQIFTIICAIVNLTSPILKDDKFNQ